MCITLFGTKRSGIQLTGMFACALLTGVLGLPATAEQSRGITLEPVARKTVTPFSEGTYRALIIGNNQYRDKHGHWRPLESAVTDAKAVKDLLQNNYGFEDVELIENATRRDVLLALDALSKRAMSNDNVLVYYAGHGFMDEETQKGFWIPVDAEGTDQSTFLRNSTIRDELTTIASRVKHTLLVSDSCFSGSLLRSTTRGMAPVTDSESYYKKVAEKKSVQIMTAGGVEYVDDNYKTSGHSPFTYFLLSELKNNDKPMLTVSELSNSVKKAVANNVDQVPENGVLLGAGDELGEFIFIKLDVEVQGVPADRVKVKVNVKQAEPTKNKPAHSDDIKHDTIPIPTL
ncbi:MAG: caspase family protein [Gammaproteobacteria bacterium]